MIRGFATNRLLITVDGVRMNTAIFRGGNVQNVISIDPFCRADEVVLGPGSIIYGSDAIGGVYELFHAFSRIFSSKRAVIFPEGPTPDMLLPMKKKPVILMFTMGAGKWAFLTSASYSDFGAYENG